MPMPSCPSMVHDNIVKSERELLTALEHLADRGVLLVTGARADDETIAHFAELFGPIRTTSYGRVQVFITSPDAKTAAHTGAAQHPHTDEPFRYCPPGFIFFHSIQDIPDGQGTSILVDGFAAAHRLREENPEAFEILASSPVEYHRQHAGEVRFSTRSKVISTTADGEIHAVRFNIRCLAPLSPTSREADQVLGAIAEFGALIEAPENQLRLHLRKGDLLVFDNHRIMHGRTSFSDTYPRQLHSCNVDRDEVHSRHRVLAAQQHLPHRHLVQGPTT